MPSHVKAGTSLFSGKTAGLIGLAFFSLFIFGPLIFLIRPVVREIADAGPQALVLMLPVGRRLSLLVSSLLFAAGVSAFGTAVGAVCASFFAAKDRRWARLAPILLLAALPIPPTIHALAWMTGWGAVRGWLTAHGFFFPSLRGWFGALWVQTMSLVPFSFGICLIALRNLDPTLIDAARTMTDDLKTLFRVGLPLIFPALVAAAVFLFVMTLSDYTVPSLFSVSVYPLEIFSDFSTENNPARALLLSVPLLVITAAVVLSAGGTIKDVATETPKSTLGATLRLDLGPWANGLVLFCLVLAFLSFFVPTFALCFDVGSAANLFAAVASAKGAIYTTAICALVSAPVALIPSLVWAGGMGGSGRVGKALWAAALMTPAIPGSLFAVGLIHMGNTPVFAPLADTLAFPIMVSVARFSPWAAILLFCFRRRIDPVLLEAAAVHEPGRLTGFMKVGLPLMLPGIAAAAILVGVLAAGELPGTLLVLPPGVDTVIPRLFTYLHYGATPQTAALSLVMSWGFLLLFAAFLWLLGRRRSDYGKNDDSSQ